MAGETEAQQQEVPFCSSNSYSFAITDLIATSQKSVYCLEVKAPELQPPKSQQTPGSSWGEHLLRSCCKEKDKLVLSQPERQPVVLNSNQSNTTRKQQPHLQTQQSLTSNISAVLTGKFPTLGTREDSFVCQQAEQRPRSSYPVRGRPGGGRQAVLVQLQRPGDPAQGGGGGRDPRPLHRAEPGQRLSAPDAIQEADEEQVGGQVLDAAEDQGPALGAPQLLLRLEDPLQTGLAERVLAGQHLRCAVELFKAHRTLQQVKES